MDQSNVPIVGDDLRPGQVADIVVGQATRQLRLGLVVAPVTGVIFVALLWAHASRLGLGLWLAAIAATSIATWRHTRGVEGSEQLPQVSRWLRRTSWMRFSIGIVWVTLPWIAMPDDRLLRAVVCGGIVCVLASAATLSSGRRGVDLGFVVSVLVVAVGAFLVRGGDFALGGAMTLLSAALFSAALGDVTNRHLGRAVELAQWNEGLSDHLREERFRLRRANELLKLQANHDPLTGLANRAQFSQHLERSLTDSRRDGSLVGVLFVDFDHFKAVNDTHGHAVGDELLRAAADRVVRILPGRALLARIGGDEFVVCLPLLSGVQELSEVAEAIVATMHDPFSFGGRIIESSFSVGAAAARPGEHAREALRRADAALYAAKRDGRNRAELHRPELDEDLQLGAAAGEALESAISDGLVVPWYQPIVDLGTGSCVGAEALARWYHESGVRPASNFVPLAAEAGLLRPLSMSIIDAVQRFSRVLTSSGGASEGGPAALLTVNMPPAVIDDLLFKLANQTSSLEGLVLEITEMGMIADLDRVAELLARVRARGARVWLDDFGVENSSLQRIVRLPIDGIKIDGSFVAAVDTDTTARAVITSVIELAAGLDLEVVAQGIETMDQARILRAMGVQFGQGYVFAPAMNETRFRVALDAGRRWNVSPAASVGESLVSSPAFR